MRDMNRTHSQGRSSFSRPRTDLCSRHNRRLDAYCCTDEQVICALCATSEHKGHTFGLLREERKRKQDELKILKEKLHSRGKAQERQKEDLLDQIREKASETDDFCEAVVTEVIDKLQTHYLDLKKLVETQQRSAESLVQKQTEDVKKRCSELNHLAHTDSDVHFLLEWPSVRQRCQRDLSDTDHLFEPFKSLQSDVDTVGNCLVELCNSKFASIMQNDQMEADEHGMTTDNYVQHPDEESLDSYEVSCSGIQTPHPQTREDFLQYACELTLDPRTAHEDLLLSPDLKEVRLAPSNARGPAVRCPERFLYRRQLLCCEGLHAENCYYEIEVTKGKAEIALAYKSIDRKSRTGQSAFGATALSWSLDCTSLHYSVSHRGSGVELTSVPEHSRIGVYLKFVEGTVSFYEVSDKMKFLYKIQDAFTEPLYPGFWIGDNCRIRICDMSK